MECSAAAAAAATTTTTTTTTVHEHAFDGGYGHKSNSNGV
jgi:hypothetical protein